MSSTTADKTDVSISLSLRPSGPKFVHWLTVAALISADVLTFALASVLFRTNGSVPRILFFDQTTLTKNPTDIFVLLAGIFILVRYTAGDYSRRKLFWDRARATTISLMLCSLPCFLIYIALPGQYSLWSEVLTWSFLLVAVPTLRHGAKLAMDFIGMWRQPTALITSSTRSAPLLKLIDDTLTLGCDVRWVALDDYDTADLSNLDHLTRKRNPVVLKFDAPNDLATCLLSEGCQQAVVATDDMQSEDFSETIHRLLECNIAVAFIPSFRRLPLSGVTTSYFFGSDNILFQVRASLQSFPGRWVKRAFDIIGAIFALIIFSPFFVVIAMAIKSDDKGPIFYAAKRTGRGGRIFRCLKFRTMAVDAEARLERWQVENPELYAEFQRTFKLVNDPRITNIGSWLRKTSLDELPQFWNVLIGDMSLVGPRPVLERELIEYYGPAAQLYKRVRPGITGIWQVRGRSDTSYAQRVVYDEWYILNWSFWYDLVIMLQTVWVVIARKGAY